MWLQAVTQAQPDALGSSGATPDITAWFEGLVPPILSYITLKNDFSSLCLDFLNSKWVLLIIVSHSLLGLLRGTNELISAKWLEQAWHIVSVKLTVGIQLRDAVERSIS